MGKNRFRKQIMSLEERIREHEVKIQLERQKAVPNEATIRYWEHEIEGYQKSLERAKNRLRRRT